MNQLGWLLKKRRESLGLTMTQVVQKAQYGRLKKGLRRLWEIEVGSPGLHMDSLNQFADVLDITPDEVGAALEADRDWEARVFRRGIEDRDHLYSLIIRHRLALVAHDPWTVVPFATNALFGDRKAEACIGAFALLWERADDLQSRCDCGDRFHIVSWMESQAGGQINGFCPGCHTHQETFGRSGQECFDILKRFLDDTDFHMSRNRFPHAIRPIAKEVLAALDAVGVDVSGVVR